MSKIHVGAKRAVAGLIIVMLLLSACSSSDKAASSEVQQKQSTVGLIIPHPIVTQIFDEYIKHMAKMGYAEGENITYIKKGPPETQLDILKMPQELVEANVDLIVVISTQVGLLVQSATQDIPIVFIAGSKPVEAGLVESLDKPGGNLTGIMIPGPEARRMQLLLEMDPRIKKLYVPHDPTDIQALNSFTEIATAAEDYGIELVERQVRNDAELQQALSEIPEDIDGIFLAEDILVNGAIDAWSALALERKLPLSAPGVTDNPENYNITPLMGYGLFVPDLAEKAARLSDQILQGAKPGDLPVETAEYYLMVNLDTAEAIGIEIPDPVLDQAQIIVRNSEIIKQIPE